ncbi:21 kDa seed protein [Hibiscus syriacus]|uniref:21 kDa seed protein n=2 Tax=Hibiscus syriacus TaxID=106335 RepID=A0A6A2YWF4_HIBSY|nr:21 kDa seed protein [Hibiscus syriacus]
MKSASASVFLLCFSITQSSFLFGLANAANNAVLDGTGKEVVTGVPYYLVSVLAGDSGGGLAIGRESGRKCPEIVVQRKSNLDYGDPVIFSNADSDADVVRVSSDVKIKFVGPRDKLCRSSTVWKVQDLVESTGKGWVELGGAEGGPACDTKDWFKIVRDVDDMDIIYNLKYCPSVRGSSITACNKIEREIDTDGQMRLALADEEGDPWPWMFIMANETDTRIRQVVHV